MESDISRYTEPVVWRQYSDPRPAELRIHTPDTILDASEIEHLAMAGVKPALALCVFLLVVMPITLSAAALVLGVGWKIIMGLWAVLVTLGGLHSVHFYHTETQHWAARRDEQIAAVIAYMMSRTGSRVEVADNAAPVILAHPVRPSHSPRQRKVARLAYWVRRAVENHGNIDDKPGPRLMRHDEGEYSVIIKTTGEEVNDKGQEADYADLVKMGLLVKTTKGYQIADPTWTLEQAADVLQKALPND